MELTSEMIEKMRAIGLRLDRDGTFWQEGAAVTHARLRQALLRWLDVRPEDGRDIIKLDDKRYAYVDVEDAHLRARSAHWVDNSALPFGSAASPGQARLVDAHCMILWDDDQEAELEYGSLRQAPDHALYASVRGLRGRIAGPAYHAVAEHIVESSRGFVLEAVGKRWPIANAA